MENLPHLLPPGIIRLDGADTGLAYRIGDVDLKTMNFGMRIKAVFRKERREVWIDSLEDLLIEGR